MCFVTYTCESDQIALRNYVSIFIYKKIKNYVSVDMGMLNNWEWSRLGRPGFTQPMGWAVRAFAGHQPFNKSGRVDGKNLDPTHWVG